MTVLTLHAQSGSDLFEAARNALNDPDSFRMYVTVGDKQIVFKPRHIEIKAPTTHGYGNPFAVERTLPASAVVELWPV